MSQATQRGPWSWESYLDWEAGQPVRYELVDGEVHAMGGGRPNTTPSATPCSPSFATSCVASPAASRDPT